MNVFATHDRKKPNIFYIIEGKNTTHKVFDRGKLYTHH